MNIQTQPTMKYPAPIIPRMAEHKYTLVVWHDDSPDNPREWDNLGTFVSFERYSSAADESHNDPEQYLIELIEQFNDGFEQRLIDKDESPSLKALLEIAAKDYVILPVYKYEHSGVAYNTTGFSCSWDSGQVGFIYISKDKLRKDYGWKRITNARRKEVEGWLAGEIEVFSQWANGNVYGFQLYYHDVEKDYTEGEEQDACWGFYYDWAPDSLKELQECGIADHLPNECLNDDLVIVFKY